MKKGITTTTASASFRKEKSHFFTAWKPKLAVGNFNSFQFIFLKQLQMIYVCLSGDHRKIGEHYEKIYLNVNKFSFSHYCVCLFKSDWSFGSEPLCVCVYVCMSVLKCAWMWDLILFVDPTLPLPFAACLCSWLWLLLSLFCKSHDLKVDFVTTFSRTWAINLRNVWLSRRIWQVSQTICVVLYAVVLVNILLRTIYIRIIIRMFYGI